MEKRKNGGINTKLTCVLASRLNATIKWGLSGTLVDICQVQVGHQISNLNTKFEYQTGMSSSYTRFK